MGFGVHVGDYKFELNASNTSFTYYFCFYFFFFSLRENMSNLHIYFTVSTTQHVLMSLGKLRTLFKIKYTFYTKKSLAL